MRRIFLVLAVGLWSGKAAATPSDLEVAFSSFGGGIAGTLRYAAVLQGKRVVAETELPPAQPSWKLRLEAGEYTLVCGAHRHATKSVRLVVAAGKQQLIRCELPPLVTVQGRLVSKGNGRPIAGGKVEPFFLALGELPFASELLEKHLRSKHQGVSDEEGRFSLGLLPGDHVVLVATAPEHALRVIGPLLVSSRGLHLGELALEAGAHVRVRVEPRGQELARETWWVDLVPAGEPQEGNSRLLDPKSVGIALLSKPLGDDGEVLFDSVPAGTYTALLSTLPERLLRRSGGSIPEGMKYRPSHSTPPFVVGVGSFQEVVLAPTRWEARVNVSGMERARCLEFEPRAFSPVLNYAVAGSWKGEQDCQFSVVLEASGAWVLGLRRREGSGESVVPLGTVSVAEGSGEKEFSLAAHVRSVEGQVLDAAGNPVFFAEVRVSNSRACSGRGFTWRGKTDREGRFFCPAAPAEPLLVWAYRPDLGWAMEEQVVDPSVLLHLLPGKEVRLRLVSEEGNPVSAQLHFSPAGAEGLTVGVVDEKGEAVIPHMPEVDGSLLVALLSPDAEARGWGHLKLWVPKAKRGFLGTFQVSEGARVAWRAAHLPEGGVFCALESEDGAIVGSDPFEALTFGGDAPRAVLLFKRWERLAPGRFRPVVTDEACKPLWRGKWFVVGPGETLELRDRTLPQ